MTVAALQLPKRRRHDAANHFAESHVARMQATDAVALADVVDSDRRAALASPGAGRADATHRLIDLGEVKQAIVDGDPARDGA